MKFTINTLLFTSLVLFSSIELSSQLRFPIENRDPQIRDEERPLHIGIYNENNYVQQGSERIENNQRILTRSYTSGNLGVLDNFNQPQNNFIQTRRLNAQNDQPIERQTRQNIENSSRFKLNRNRST